MGSSSEPSHCQRNLSRVVRTYVEQNILARQSFDRLALPPDCPLHPLNDPFHFQEKNFTRYFPCNCMTNYTSHHESFRISFREYQCLFCKKRFKNMFYLDRHMDNKHQDRLLQSDHPYCLQELCPFIGCLTTDIHTHRKSFNGFKVCRQRILDHAKGQCSEVIDRWVNQSIVWSS